MSTQECKTIIINGICQYKNAKLQLSMVYVNTRMQNYNYQRYMSIQECKTTIIYQ